MIVKILTFGSSQEAWEGVNEYIANNQPEIEQRGGGKYGNEMISYNHFIEVRKAWINPEFDFGNLFGYRLQKWTGLVNNYVNFNYLDIVKSEVLLREKKKAVSYNLSMHFDNSHGSGKGCLLSLTFARRLDYDYPILIFNLRASEATKRLIFDFLLIQRIGEYVYGKDQHFGIHLWANMCYITAESFSMYHHYKPLEKVLGPKPLNEFQQKCLDMKNHYSTVEPSLIKYKVNRRAVNQLQRCKDGHPLSGNKPMYAKDLELFRRK